MTVVSKLLQHTTALVATLSQTRTNGASNLGTFNAPRLPAFFSNNPISNGFPWGSKSCQNSDPYFGGPDTGVVRSYDFTIARGTVAPDGFSVDTILINGQYPGPLIEANWGDTIQVTVHNEIRNPEEGTTMHWHGINQQYTEWMDGVPAVSMCPIAPGSSYVYSFKATPYGSTWYHSHFSGQSAGGLWGPLVIYGPKNDDYDIDLGPVTLNDYFHRDYFSVLQDVEGTDLTKVRPASDNNLINGKMNFDCGTSTENNTNAPCVNNAGLSKFSFTSGKKYRLRLINTGVQAIQKFSIDGHTMTVIANDFIPIEPYETKIVTLAIGQRSDVIVEATGSPTDIVWMRSHITSGQCTEPANQPEALATIYYEKANTTAAPPQNGTGQTDTTDPCANDALSKTIPSYVIPANPPSTTLQMDVNVALNATGHIVWTINNSTFRGNYNNPILLLAKTGNVSYPMDPEWNVYNVGSNASVRVVITNLSPTSHPWHFHGHEMQVLAFGPGTWDGSSIVNAGNPQRRDVALLPANGYLVVQWESNNPGVWPFHCHIAWHLSGGLYSNILEQPEAIERYPIPSTAFQNCRDWATWSGGNLVDQIDSGL